MRWASRRTRGLGVRVLSPTSGIAPRGPTGGARPYQLIRSSAARLRLAASARGFRGRDEGARPDSPPLTVVPRLDGVPPPSGWILRPRRRARRTRRDWSTAQPSVSMPVPGFLGVDIPRWRDDDEGAGASSPSFLTRVPSLRVERAIGSGMDYLDSKRIISDASTEARVRECMPARVGV